MKLYITLTGGVEIVVDVLTWSLDNQGRINWTSPEGSERRLGYLNAEHVAAIVETSA